MRRPGDGMGLAAMADPLIDVASGMVLTPMGAGGADEIGSDCEP